MHQRLYQTIISWYIAGCCCHYSISFNYENFINYGLIHSVKVEVFNSILTLHGNINSVRQLSLDTLLDGIVVTPSQILVKCNKDSIRQFPYDILQDIVVINRLIFTLKYAREDPTSNGLNLKRKELFLLFLHPLSMRL